VDGQLVFGGDASAPTYQVNLQNPNGVERLAQTASTRQIQDSTGVAFSASESAQSIFDRRNPDDSLAGDNVFAALNQLRTSLVANDQQGIAQAGNSIQQAQNWMNGKLGFYGAVQNRIRTATDIADSYQTHEEAALSQLRDTDVAAAALESTQVQANLTAAMASQARMPFTSLFDYLK
jgi:flagellin-like hook-associated protein FlgL